MKMFYGTSKEISEMVNIPDKKVASFLGYYPIYEKMEIVKVEKKKIKKFKLDLTLFAEAYIFRGDVREANKISEFPVGLQKSIATFKEDYLERVKLVESGDLKKIQVAIEKKAEVTDSLVKVDLIKEVNTLIDKEDMSKGRFKKISENNYKVMGKLFDIENAQKAEYTRATSRNISITQQLNCLDSERKLACQDSLSRHTYIKGKLEQITTNQNKVLVELDSQRMFLNNLKSSILISFIVVIMLIGYQQTSLNDKLSDEIIGKMAYNNTLLQFKKNKNGE